MSRQNNTSRKSRTGFSLIELVIVVVIIGIIAAIAIPRMSRGSAGAADAALQQNLSLLRNAVDMYQQEHNGSLPTVAGFVDQMTGYSSPAGATSTEKNSTYYLGPYLRSIPPITVGDNAGKNGVILHTATATSDTAWKYDPNKGNITPHTGEKTEDASGRLYTSY